MFDRVQVQALAGPLKDIQRLVLKPLLCCLGYVLKVIFLLEGEPSPQSEVLSAYANSKAAVMCLLLRIGFRLATLP